MVRVFPLSFVMTGFILSALSGCAGPTLKQGTPRVIDPVVEQKINTLQQRLSADPNETASYLELGKIFMSECMFTEAIETFQRLLTIDPHHVQTHILLALAYQKEPSPDFSKAIIVLENASRLWPDNPDVHLNLAQVYDRLGQQEKAISEFDRTIKLANDAPTLLSAHLGLMAIYTRQGESAKANEEYQAAYKIYPGVEKILRRAEINRITPAPKYVGDAFVENDVLHPSLEKRIQQVRDEVMKLSQPEK